MEGGFLPPQTTGTNPRTQTESLCVYYHDSYCKFWSKSILPPSNVIHSTPKEDAQKLMDETAEAKAYQDVSLSSLLSLTLLYQFPSTAFFFSAI
ncbi:unnamed protein product [Vicia faba]|uniref:Uncharacterized protein n=1 Tax=Vicia faba TaxID=3906 RepID=A0AAV1AWP1_VICFA|nr:unnamed protein product [Vicia faba]